MQFDIDKLLEAFKQFEDYDSYLDLEANTENCSFKDLCQSRESLHKKFLSPEEKVFAEKSGKISSKQYRQLALTELRDDIEPFQGDECNKSFLTFRQVNKVGSESYVPSFDERNYTKRKLNCTGYWNYVLDQFKSQVTRTRFAYLAPKSRIGSHVDYDTRYSIRVHIPIVTNPSSHLFVQGCSGDVKKLHFPADGGVYFLNTGLSHWAENNGDTERVHLIVSINGQRDLRGMSADLD